MRAPANSIMRTSKYFVFFIGSGVYPEWAHDRLVEIDALLPW
jgi:hypothetical protein